MFLKGLNGQGLVLAEPKLTPSQARCAVAVAFLLAEHGTTSFRKIAAMCEVNVRATAQTMAILRKKGLVQWEKGAERNGGTIRLTRPLVWRECMVSNGRRRK